MQADVVCNGKIGVFFKSFVHVYKEGGAFFALGVRSSDECSNAVYYVYPRAAEQITCNLLHRKVRSPDVI